MSMRGGRDCGVSEAVLRDLARDSYWQDAAAGMQSPRAAELRSSVPVLEDTLTDAPIGVFDSGVGGLTVLRALLAEMPAEHFIYLGDTARLPYGTKSGATVVRYALQATELLIRQSVKCIVVACSTASSVALGAMREHFKPLPVIGVIEPGADAACRESLSGHIAVMATEGTLRAGVYERAIRRLRPRAQITVRAAPLLVALAEEGISEGPIAESIAHHYLDDVFDGASSPDTLVLGCTHFPILAKTIRAVTGPAMRIVDAAATTARIVRARVPATRSDDVTHAGQVRFYATDGAERLARIGSRLLNRSIPASEIELVDL
jgi:glutamate racemase